MEDVKVDATTPRNDLETSFTLPSYSRSLFPFIYGLSCEDELVTRSQIASLEEQTVPRLRGEKFLKVSAETPQM